MTKFSSFKFPSMLSCVLLYVCAAFDPVSLGVSRSVFIQGVSLLFSVQFSTAVLGIIDYT